MKRSSTRIDLWHRTVPALTVAIAIVALSAAGCGDAIEGMSHGPQPVQFNHSLHTTELEMDCSECHQSVMTSRKATLPTRDLCIECHEEAQGESQEEQKLVALLETESELDWQRIYVLPKHVYFSHFRHVTLGQIGCQTCHGEMNKLTAPPTSMATDALDMDYCIDCHTERRETTDCLACHM